MSAGEALRTGDVDAALQELFDEVRAEPDKAKHRIFLFQLLCVAGQWDRALTQLNVAHELDPAAGMMANAYQEILHCEAYREKVFAGTHTPLVFGEPAPWIALMIEALQREAKGEREQAEQLRGEALEAAPATPGKVTCRASEGLTSAEEEPSAEHGFEWIADGDSRLGPILELIVNGRYYWAPWDRIAEVVIEPPADLRDVVWMPAHFRWANEGEAVGVIPTRYPGSQSHEDGAIRMARRTSWEEPSEQTYLGLGQRVLMTNDRELGLMDVRRIELQAAS